MDFINAIPGDILGVAVADLGMLVRAGSAMSLSKGYQQLPELIVAVRWASAVGLYIVGLREKVVVGA